MTGARAFAFTAVRRDGAREAGIVEAPSHEAAVALLASRGVFPTAVTPADTLAVPRARLTSEDLALGMQALSTLLDAGLPLARALALLVELVPPGWHTGLVEIRRRIDQGERLSSALERSGLPFPPDVIGIVQAGEGGSSLAAAAASAAQLLEQRAAARAALRTALAYPAMLAVAGTASLALLVGVVLPRFTSLLTEYGQALPLSTRLVLGAASIVKVASLPALVVLAGCLVWWRGRRARVEALPRMHGWLLRMPAVGPIRFASGTAHACTALAALLEAGVPLVAALPHAARASGDTALAERLLRARARITRGERIGTALQAEAAATPVVIRLVRVGEETGRLAGMLAHAGRIEADRALRLLQRLTRGLEPALIVAFGGVVMIVAAALLQAMYGLRPAP